MKIFLAGQNGAHSIIGEQMRIYLAGAVSGNLKPAWVKTKQPTFKSFMQGLKDENF